MHIFQLFNNPVPLADVLLLIISATQKTAYLNYVM